VQGDEEGNPILPLDIDPEDVVRIKDGYICGGALTSEGGESFQFTMESVSEAIEWLKHNWGKCDAELLAELAQAV
jgi:hypothetical protein